MTARTLLAALAGAAAIVLAVRLVYGPFSLAGVSVHTAMNPAGAFGLLVTLLLIAAKSSANRVHETVPARYWIGLAILTAGAFFEGLRVGFLSDDFALLALSADWSPARFLADLRTPGGDGFWRPAGLASLGLNQIVVGRDALLWHIATLGLHTANAALVGILASRLGASRFGALFAAALFAIHGGRPEAAVWIASRFDLQAVFFALLATLLWERGRHAWGVAAFVLGAMSKEAVYVLPAVLVCLAWYRRQSWRTTIPYFAAGAVLFVYRWTLFRGIGGYSVDGQEQFYSFNLVTVKALFVRLWTGLHMPVNWTTEPSLSFGIAALFYLAAILYLAWNAKPERPLWPVLGALLLAVLPALHLLSVPADLEGQRLVYFPSVFFCLLLSLAIRDRVRAAACAVLIFHVAALHHNLAEWRYASGKVDAACAEAALYPSVHITGLPRTIRGVHAFVHGIEECVNMAAGRPVSVTTEGPLPAGAVHLEWDSQSERLRAGAP